MGCTVCGGQLDLSSGAIVANFKDEEIEVSGIEHYVCSGCGEVEFDLDKTTEYSKAVKDAYRHKHGLLSPLEIKKIRKGLGLTQQQFQKMLGVGKTMVSRWETGALVQQKNDDNLLRETRDHVCVAKDLMMRAGFHKEWENLDGFPVCIKNDYTVIRGTSRTRELSVMFQEM